MTGEPASTVTRAPTPSGLLRRTWSLWLPLWRHAERLNGWFFHLAALAVMHLITGGGYLLVSRINAARGVTVWDPALPIDRAIPALGWTIFPYVSYYAYGLLTVLVTPRTAPGRRRLIALYQGLIAMTLVVFAFFLLLPCEIHLVRDLPVALVEGPGAIPTLFRWLHGVDRPWNAWPSHHACVSLVIALYVARGARRWTTRAAMGTAWGLLALSILTTKQHFIFDLVTGVALGWGTWRLVVRPSLEALEGLASPAASDPQEPTARGREAGVGGRVGPGERS